jgi:peptidoglycan/xylan/chitin deacetylase (PgdA/CDA1 family)
MYHNFPADISGLRRQCEHLRRFYHPVSMRQVSEAISGGPALPDRAVAITIDDGYRDFLLNAYPVFHEFGIPTTVFLVSEFLDGNDWNWWDKLHYALQQTSETQFELHLKGERRVLPVLRGQEYQQMYQLAGDLKALPNSQLRGELARLFEQLRVTIPQKAPAWCEPMTWDEVRQLARTNVEFGAHTKTHPILSTVESKQELEDEIRGSLKRVEKELNAPVLHFCYPNGRNEDIGGEALRITRESGFRTAVTTVPGMNRIGPTTDPFQLKRLGTDPGFPDYYFAELLAGVRTG